MDYKELNQNQKKRMEQVSKKAFSMRWENPEFMEYLSGKLPKVKIYQNDRSIEYELRDLDSYLGTYNAFFTDKDSFLNEIERKKNRGTE